MAFTPRMIVFAVLAALGVVLPWFYNLQFFATPEGKGGIAAFVAGGFANPAAASLSVDLTIACVAFLIWMAGEARRLGMRHWWAYIAITFGIAFACACPLFLLMRERRLVAMQARS